VCSESCHQLTGKNYVEEGYAYVVSMDLEKFDTVKHSKRIEVLSHTIKDGRVISLIHKNLNAGVQETNSLREPKKVYARRSFESAFGNKMLNELDKELECRGHKFVRFAGLIN